MPSTLRHQLETPCPACGDGSGVPLSVVSAVSREIRINLRCDNCEHDWTVTRVADSAPAAARPTPAKAMLDWGASLRVKPDRRTKSRS